jgi:heme-degrading monooxygenase HmoA
MYIRATRVQAPPDKVEDLIRNFETNVLKRVRAASGYQGAVLLLNRQTGEGIGTTYWESARALGASEQVGSDSRTQATKDVSGARIINVERAEVMIMDRAAPPKTGTFVRGISGAADPEKLDAGINVARTKALPILKALKGYRTFFAAVDRQSGRVLVSTSWETMADLEASESKIAATRAEFAKAAGILPETLKVEVFEVPVVELSAAALAMASKS